MKTIKSLLIVLSCITLCQCAAPPISKKEVTTNQKYPLWQQHNKSVDRLSNWRAEGRLAVSYQKDGGNANFVWEQFGDHFSIKLFGPFGAGASEMKGTPSRVVFQDETGQTHFGNSPESLMQQILGWHVPIEGLQYWARGIPTPDDPIQKIEITKNEGTLVYLQQNGWHIDYNRYLTDNAPRLPGKMQLENQDLKVKLIIKKWKLL